MSVTAEDLNISNSCKKDIDNFIADQLTSIDETLQRIEKKWGNNQITYTLPLIIPFPGIEQKEAKYYVFGSIIASLEKRKFKVKLSQTQRRDSLIIQWFIGLDPKEIEKRRLIVEKAKEESK